MTVQGFCVFFLGHRILWTTLDAPPILRLSESVLQHLILRGAILVKWTMGILSMQTVHPKGHHNRANVWEIAKFRRLLECVYDIQNSVQDGSKQNCQSGGYLGLNPKCCFFAFAKTLKTQGPTPVLYTNLSHGCARSMYDPSLLQILRSKQEAVQQGSTTSGFNPTNTGSSFPTC